MEFQYVYVFYSTSGHYKIGMTGNIRNRLKQIQATAGPYTVYLKGWVQVPDAREYERELHQRFADSRVNGEWFSLANDEVEYLEEWMPAQFHEWDHTVDGQYVIGETWIANYKFSHEDHKGIPFSVEESLRHTHATYDDYWNPMSKRYHKRIDGAWYSYNSATLEWEDELDEHIQWFR